MTGFINSGILRRASAAAFPRYGDFDGSVNDSITPSFIDCIFLIAVSPVFAAGPSEHVRAIVSGIVTYTRWPSLTGAPKLCIFASSRFTHSLAHEDPDALPYQPVIVRNREEALKTTCDGFYFGSESPTEQSELTRRYGPRPLLLIAEQNTDCSIGSAFCLIINDDRVRFSVNLDVLTHSGVRVNPDVLMLARKKPHE